MDETTDLAGMYSGTVLHLIPGAGGSVILIAQEDRPGQRARVTVRPEWLRPLAAWLAGESRLPSVSDVEDGGALVLLSDERALIWNERTWARLECRMPFGPAHVSLHFRGLSTGCSVFLSPEARLEAATLLRRQDARTWTAANASV